MSVRSQRCFGMAGEVCWKIGANPGVPLGFQQGNCAVVPGGRPAVGIASVGQRWEMPAAAGALPSGLKLLAPVPPSNLGKSQREMFSNTAEHGSAFPRKWQHGPDVSQGN